MTNETLDSLVEFSCERKLLPNIVRRILAWKYCNKGEETLGKRYREKSNETVVLQRARRSFEMAIKLGSENYWAYGYLAMIYNDLEVKEQDFIETKSMNEKLPNLKSVYYYQKGSKLASVEEMSGIVELLGEEVDTEKVEEGIKFLKKGLEIDPHNATILYTIARAQEKKGAIDDAISSYEKLVIESGTKKGNFVGNMGFFCNPFHKAEPYDRLVELYTKKGMLKEAEEAEKKSFELEPYPKIMREVDRRLNAIAEIDSNYIVCRLGVGEMKDLINQPREKLLAFARGDYEKELERQIPDLIERFGQQNEKGIRRAISYPCNYLRGFSIKVLRAEKDKRIVPDLIQLISSESPDTEIHYSIYEFTEKYFSHASCWTSLKTEAALALFDIDRDFAKEFLPAHLDKIAEEFNRDQVIDMMIKSDNSLSPYERKRLSKNLRKTIKKKRKERLRK